MKLNALHALVAAIDEGSLRGAARRLGVSQPALTKMVRELERELAATLLARSSTGVTATEQGLVLYERAKPMLRELDVAVDQIGQLGGKMTGELNIAAVPLAVVSLIPEAIRSYSRQFPDIHLRVNELLYTAQLALLRKGDVDMAIGPVPPGLPPGEFLIEPLIPVDMVVVARKGSTLGTARSLAALAQARWVYTSVVNDGGYVRHLHEAHGLPAPRPGAVVNSTLGLLSLIVNLDHVGLMPLPMARHPSMAPHLVVVPLAEGPLRLDIGLMLKPQTALRPAVKEFTRHLLRAAHHYDPGL